MGRGQTNRKKIVVDPRDILAGSVSPVLRKGTPNQHLFGIGKPVLNVIGPEMGRESIRQGTSEEKYRDDNCADTDFCFDRGELVSNCFWRAIPKDSSTAELYGFGYRRDYPKHTRIRKSIPTKGNLDQKLSKSVDRQLVAFKFADEADLKEGIVSICEFSYVKPNSDIKPIRNNRGDILKSRVSILWAPELVVGSECHWNYLSVAGEDYLYYLDDDFRIKVIFNLHKEMDHLEELADSQKDAS